MYIFLQRLNAQRGSVLMHVAAQERTQFQPKIVCGLAERGSNWILKNPIPADKMQT